MTAQNARRAVDEQCPGPAGAWGGDAGSPPVLLGRSSPPQRGVYIIGDLEDSAAHQHRHRKKKRGGRRDGAALATAAADAPSAILASSSGESSGSESEAEGLESDTEAESDAESDAEVPAGAALLASSAPPQLAGIAAAAAGAEPPPPLAFSRDAAERLWREQHLGIAGSAQGQQAVTALALDLMLLSVLSSGNDYLPAIQVGRLLRRRRVLASGCWGGGRSVGPGVPWSAVWHAAATWMHTAHPTPAFLCTHTD